VAPTGPNTLSALSVARATLSKSQRRPLTFWLYIAAPPSEQVFFVVYENVPPVTQILLRT